MLLAFNKPYGVLSQFTPEPGSAWRTLAEFKLPKGVYPVGRLDADSEGLLLLTDEPGLNSALLDPQHQHTREYWAQVEGSPNAAALDQLSQGVKIGDYQTRPARAWRLDDQTIPFLPRIPPIRVRKTVPTAWIALELIEGKNRQVRKMTAAVGHPTLRLVRVRIQALRLLDLGLPPGTWKPVRLEE